MLELTKPGIAISFAFSTVYSSAIIVGEYTALFLEQIGYSTFVIGFAPILGVITQTVGTTLTTYLADKYRARKLILFCAILVAVPICLLFVVIPTPQRICETPTEISNTRNTTTRLSNTSSYSSINTSFAGNIDRSKGNINTTGKNSPLHNTLSNIKVDKNNNYWLEYILIFIAIRGIFDFLKQLSTNLIVVATLTHVKEERNKVGYYISWGYIGSAISILLVGVLLQNMKHLVCGSLVPNYVIIFIFSMLVQSLTLLCLPWMKFDYLEDRVIDYDEIKGVLTKPHYILMLILCVYGGFALGYLLRWEFWYLDQLGGTPITIAICGVSRRILNGVYLILSRKVIDTFGELTVINISLFIYFITHAALAFVPNLWAVLVADNIQAMSHVLLIATFIIHFSKAASEASAAFFQGMVSVIYFGLGQEISSAVIGILFLSYGTTITFCCFSLISLVFWIIFTIYLFTAKDLDRYTRIKDYDKY